jgi:glycosyltransferase involved in cell wall biosynthesis
LTSRLPRRSVFLAFYTACPPTGGASAVTFQLARHWPGERLLVQVGGAAAEAALPEGLRVIGLASHGDGERWRKLVRVPLWVAQMASIARRFGPDTIVIEGASWAAYSWLLMLALRLSAPGARLIYHAHNVEYDLRRQRHSRFIAALTRWFEGRVLARADVATAVSDVDASRIKALYGLLTVLLPNGVDVDWLRSATDQDVRTVRERFGLPPETVLFMGAYGYRPNREAIDFLVENVFPGLIQRRPSARLLILGGAVPYERPWLIAPGLVPFDDLPSFIRCATVSAAPIFSGSGTRLKIIESLASGIPVVTTAKGMEGLELEPSEYLGLAESAEEFVEKLDARLAMSGQRRSPLLPSTAMAAFRWDWLVECFTAAF